MDGKPEEACEGALDIRPGRRPREAEHAVGDGEPGEIEVQPCALGVGRTPIPEVVKVRHERRVPHREQRRACVDRARDVLLDVALAVRAGDVDPHDVRRSAFFPLSFSHRATMTSQNLGSSSIARHRVEVCSAAAMAVPEPPKGS